MGIHKDLIVDSDPKCEIDITSRNITNKSAKNFVIQYDHNSERINFTMDRYVEGHDMAVADRIAIKYLNSRKSDMYIVDDLEVSENANKITFSWLISGNVTASEGQLIFLINFRCVDDNGNITYNWSTKPCSTFSILKGVESMDSNPAELYDFWAKYEDKVNAVTKNSASAEAKLIELTSESDDVTDKIATLITHTGELVPTVAELKNDMPSLEAKASAIKQVLPTLEQKINALNLVVADEPLAALTTEVTELENVLTECQKLIGLRITKDEFVPGVINTDGTIVTECTQNNYYSVIIDKNYFESITITPASGYFINYASYNGSTFVSRSTWSTSPITIDNTNDVRILFATVAYAETYTSIEEMMRHYTIAVEQRSNNVRTEMNELNENVDGLKSSVNDGFLNYYMCCESADKLIHFSFDDVRICLNDLAVNSGTYTSIFDNAFIAALKNTHDEFGVVFTLNCYNVDVGLSYDISNLPDKFKIEVKANKSWLRFAFHGNSAASNYANEPIINDYNKFIAGITKFAGGIECIDTIPRLHTFSGILDNIKAMKNSSVPIVGLLTADDTRLSYYLNSRQNNLAIHKGKYIDCENELVLIKTMPRLDSYTIDDISSMVENNHCLSKYVEIFCHETENYSGLLNRIKDVASWANENGYTHGFPCDVFKPIS